MKPASFSYLAPTTLADALVMLNEHSDDAKILAGGQSLIPVMNFRLAQPATLIDLNTTGGLDQLSLTDDGTLVIGCMVRQATLETDPLVESHAPLIQETMPVIAHAQIRNRGTIGGSLAHADPAAELPVLMITLGASFKLESVEGARLIPASDFYTDLFETALQPNELLTEIHLPKLEPGTGTAFHEISRRHGDYAMAGAAARVQLSPTGVCQDAKLVFLNVGPIPTVTPHAAEQLIGHLPTPDLIESVAAHAATQEMDPSADIHASAEYRRHLAQVLAKRAMRDAFNRAQHS